MPTKFCMGHAFVVGHCVVHKSAHVQAILGWAVAKLTRCCDASQTAGEHTHTGMQECSEEILAYQRRSRLSHGPSHGEGPSMLNDERSP